MVVDGCRDGRRDGERLMNNNSTLVVEERAVRVCGRVNTAGVGNGRGAAVGMVP